MTCGSRLPSNLNERFSNNKSKSKRWIYPITAVLVGCLLLTIVYGIVLHKRDQALELYEEASQIALVGDYDQAKSVVEEAINNYSSFPQAEELKAFLTIAIEMEQSFADIASMREEGQYSQAIETLIAHDRNIENYNGELVSKVKDKINVLKTETRMDEISSIYESNPDINQLKVLLWELERLNSEKAEELHLDVKDKLVSLTYQEGTALIQKFQFSQALRLVEETLNFVQDSDSLINLRKTIEKEQLAFENQQQQRIEQALSAYESEETHNKEYGIEVISINTETEDEKLKVIGEIESVATVPLHSVLVHYEILDDQQNVLLTNEVYIQPETLYPRETGNFEFIHVDAEIVGKRVSAKIKEITWYLE
ncbi:hypothetical protein GGQ92_000058 [Gracilibacillus halotolerans]|uniref:Uncharacterized protein n=1 Tax=Gracilibacillus halotolerans TaxID=74386 RepID=A0A841RFE0_9BACI|nr:hypothetical protein [Gracilibacillus halotolerans]MBB6511291.1 hypothetical protein [Gracilibacillus halotolerans]